MKTIEVYKFNHFDESKQLEIIDRYREDIEDCYRDYLIDIIASALGEKGIRITAIESVHVINQFKLTNKRLADFLNTDESGWYFDRFGRAVEAYTYGQLSEPSKRAADQSGHDGLFTESGNPIKLS